MNARSACCGVTFVLALGFAPCALAQAAHPSSNDDMAMPDDLGAPLPGAPAEAAAPTSGKMSVAMPIGRIAANPKGKAVLEQHLHGLCERPEYVMFKGMSMTKLADMSHGRISAAELSAIQADLQRIEIADTATLHRYGLFTRSARQARWVGHAVAHRVRIVLAAL